MPVTMSAIDMEIKPVATPNDANKALSTGKYGAKNRSSMTRTPTARLVDSRDSKRESLMN